MDLYEACAAGETDIVRRILAQDPTLAARPGGPRGWPPLLYACFTKGADTTACAALLLANGADPNSSYVEPDWPDSPQSALYGACGVLGHAALTRLLLSAGARTQDGESLYHAAEGAHLECLEALLEAGADLGARQEPWGNTPLYFLLGHDPAGRDFATVLRGLRWLLEHGADPDVESYQGQTPLHAAARKHSGEVVDLLLRHGADPRAGAPPTPYAVAVRHGNVSAAEAFEKAGADSPLSPEDRLLGALARGDEAEARRLRAEGVEPGDEWRVLATRAAWDGRVGTLRLAARLDLPLDRPGEMGATPLHHAAWNGHLDAVEAVLATRPPLDLADATHQATPLGWACHGSLFCRREPRGDYAGVVRALLGAGSPRPDAPEGSPEVLEALRAERD